MSRLDAALQLWADPRIGILTFVIVGVIAGCGWAEWREHHR